MGKGTAILLVLLLLAAGYIYYSNPRVIDNIIDNAKNIRAPEKGQSGAGVQEKGWKDADGNGSPDIYIGDGIDAIRVNSTYIIFADRNKDGKIDAIYLDTTGDGNYDTAYLDEDYNGRTDTWKTALNGVESYAWDVTGDGIPDLYDTNGDGKVDAWDINSDGTIDERDIDFDGKPDLHDYNFDGTFDEFQEGTNFAPPSNGTSACPPTKEEAYKLFVRAYNNVTSLQQANASQEVLEEAYAKYLDAKACYDSFNGSGGTASSDASGMSIGDIKEATLKTPDEMAIKFSTGEIKAGGNWNEIDIGLEPWCVDYAAVIGHYIDIGEKSLENLTSSDIPASGYPTNEVSGEVKTGHVYINKNSDGTYTAFEILSHEKLGDCNHRAVIRYRNLGER